MNNIKYLIAIAAFAFGTTALTGCSEDEYTSRGDLFQPRLIDNYPLVDSNNIEIAWYEVNDAVGYTVELYTDNYYTNKFMTIDVTQPYVDIQDIPYGTTFYIKLRSNAADPAHNSQWNSTNAKTEARPAYASIVEDVSKTEITESEATIRWKVDPENPADSISIVPKMDTTLPTITRMLTAEEIAQGSMTATGLEKNTLYSVNLYDTSKPRKYDKPYNEITFRTAGPAAQSIQIGLLDDLSTILSDNNEDPEIPEGTEYYLPAGSTFQITPFSIKKGFRIVGATGGDKPIIEMNGNFNFTEDAYVQSLEFENVEFRNSAQNQYFLNCGNSYTLESVSFVNVNFKNIMRGFWRHQGNNTKVINSIELEGCWFDQCGWQTGTYGTFYLKSDKSNVTSYDQVDKMSIKNCTFSRGGYTENSKYGWGNILDYGNSECPIELTVKNVTIYDFCVNSRVFDLNNAAGSKVVMSGVLMASPSGDLFRVGAGSTTTFSNNYTTSDYLLGGSKINATDLDVSAAEIFADPANGDYTIKDETSPIYTNRAGDTRWIK